ncbi:unnamed protein product [Blepharisma stoltei]|uniref:Enoyl-CoA hydratase n=1 Tax=Blepharisma stoltei TaxID=1481888 RepID=A0AAU9IR14_9CILI|nr:unnamed protein product [Blepharisma stoltei]
MSRKRLSIIAQHLCSAEWLATYQETSDGVAIITINRPSKLNFLNKEMWDQLNSYLLQAESNPNIKVIILAGIGKPFANGESLPAKEELIASPVIINDPTDNWFGQLASMKKPIIAPVNDYVCDEDFEIAMICDIVIANSTARFVIPKSKMRLIHGAVGTESSVKTARKLQVTELVLVGDVISADEAKRIGLINKVVENTLDEAITAAKETASSPLGDILTAKKAISLYMKQVYQKGSSTNYIYLNKQK